MKQGAQPHKRQDKGNQKTSYYKDLQELEVKVTDKIEAPKIAWLQKTDNGDSILGTLGNFSLITGKAKSRKSFFVNMIASSVLSQKEILNNKLFGDLPENKRHVLYFDTEQGKYHVQLALNRICRQIGEHYPKNLNMYCLRSKKPSERLGFIEYAIYNTPNLGFVIIDGIKDLVTSINDEAEATNIASNLLKWTEETEIHIVTVLHQNKGDNKARGHIGTELMNKAETVLSIEKSNEISIVKPDFCRNIPPETFAFKIDKKDIPVITGDFKLDLKVNKERKSKAPDIFSLSDKEQYQVLKDMFSSESSFMYGELKEKIRLTYVNLYGKSLGVNTAKDFITHCKNIGWLLQEKKFAPYTLNNF